MSDSLAYRAYNVARMPIKFRVRLHCSDGRVIHHRPSVEFALGDPRQRFVRLVPGQPPVAFAPRASVTPDAALMQRARHAALTGLTASDARRRPETHFQVTYLDRQHRARVLPTFVVWSVDRRYKFVCLGRADRVLIGARSRTPDAVLWRRARRAVRRTPYLSF